MKSFFQWLSRLFGKNVSFTPKSVILDQLNEPRPLPMGRVEFMMWSDRIIAGALIPNDPRQSHEVYIDSARYALANMIIASRPYRISQTRCFLYSFLEEIRYQSSGGYDAQGTL